MTKSVANDKELKSFNRVQLSVLFNLSPSMWRLSATIAEVVQIIKAQCTSRSPSAVSEYVMEQKWHHCLHHRLYKAT